MPRVVMGLVFFPRGGSAQVARYLARMLPEAGWEVSIASGSLGPPGAESNAASFYAGLDVRSLDYTEAAEAPDPLAADPPFQPSYEDRPGAPDRVFASVDDDALARLATTWERQLAAAGAGQAALPPPHPPTPINPAPERAFPPGPRGGPLPGTRPPLRPGIAPGPPPGREPA